MKRSLDKKLIWHPFTQEKISDPILFIKKAQGSYVYDEHGRAYLDLISSWWVNLHGHSHPTIAHAVYDQASVLEHVLFAGCTHEPAITLCTHLQAVLPASLSKFFFSDNGSTSVEVALKMAYQYWSNQGKTEKKIFLSFTGGYHGDTFGAMSVGAQSGFHHPFRPFFFQVLYIPFPETWPGDEYIEQKEHAAIDALEKHLKDHQDTIAAIIVEPLVQGASGMRMCRHRFLQNMLQRVRQKDILIIYDEVMTGFGRTGTLFALNHMNITPDFLCLSKGITGGFLPLAVTITTKKIHAAFLSDQRKKAFLHGHSYTANPIACTAAVASLALLLQAETQRSIHAIHQAHKQGLIFLKEMGLPVQKMRLLGTLAAFDLTRPIPHVSRYFLERGLLLRPLKNTVYLLPPYSTTTVDLQDAYEKIAAVLKRYGT